jgi:hypothetical protein
MLRPACSLPAVRLSPPHGLSMPRLGAKVSPQHLGPAIRRTDAFRSGTLTRWTGAASVRHTSPPKGKSDRRVTTHHARSVAPGVPRPTQSNVALSLRVHGIDAVSDFLLILSKAVRAPSSKLRIAIMSEDDTSAGSFRSRGKIYWKWSGAERTREFEGRPPLRNNSAAGFDWTSRHWLQPLARRSVASRKFRNPNCARAGNVDANQDGMARLHASTA